MMFLFLGHFGHCVYEINRIGKIIELKRAFDVLLLQFPFRDFFEPRFQLIRFHQISHNGTTSNTRKSFCNAKTSVCLYDYHPDRSLFDSLCSLSVNPAEWRIPLDCVTGSWRDPSNPLYFVPLRSE